MFKKDSEAGVMVGVNLFSEDASNQVHNVKIPQLYLVNVQDYRGGQVMLPVHQVVLSMPSLRTPKGWTTRADLSINVIRQQSDTTFTVVLRELAKLTKSGALAQNPYAQGVSLASELFFNILDSKNDTQNKLDRPITGAVTMRLDPGRTGVYGILLSSKTQNEPGFVELARFKEYEFKYEQEPIPGLLVKRKNTGGPFLPVLNTHVMMTLDAVGRNRSSQKRIVPVRHAIQSSQYKAQDSPTYVAFAQSGSSFLDSTEKLRWKLNVFEQVPLKNLFQEYGTLGEIGSDTIWQTSEEDLFVSDLVQANLRRAFLGVTNAPTTVMALVAQQQAVGEK